MNGVIPARGGKGREVLDSAFLLAYARRLEGRARWTAVGYGLVGVVFGYGVGAVLLLIKVMITGMTGLMPLLVQRWQHQPVVETVDWWGYLPWVTAAIFGGLWASRGLAKSDERRFQAQLALHILKLQEMVGEGQR